LPNAALMPAIRPSMSRIVERGHPVWRAMAWVDRERRPLTTSPKRSSTWLRLSFPPWGADVASARAALASWAALTPAWAGFISAWAVLAAINRELPKADRQIMRAELRMASKEQKESLRFIPDAQAASIAAWFDTTVERVQRALVIVRQLGRRRRLLRNGHLMMVRPLGDTTGTRSRRKGRPP
jgi:hypothetical protein